MQPRVIPSRKKRVPKGKRVLGKRSGMQSGVFSETQVKRIAGGSRALVSRLPMGVFPKTTVVKLQYVTAVSLNPTYSTQQEWAYHYFRAHSIHDPDYTGIGHQPRGHDELASHYSRYHVLSSTCHVKVGSAGTATQDQVIVALNIDKDATAPPGYANDQWSQLENQGTSWVYCADGDGAIGVKSLTKRYNAKQYFGSIWDAEDTGSSFGTNPNRNVYFRLGAISADATTTSAPTRVNCVVSITYVVELSGRLDIVSS